MHGTNASHCLTLKTNLADSGLTRAMKSGAITSDLVRFDFCGPTNAYLGFKPMVRDHAFDAGELAIVTFFQAKLAGVPLVMLPVPVVGRFQHHCAAYCSDTPMHPKDIEGRCVGVRSYSQTTGMWVRGVLQHDYDVNLDRVTWLAVEQGHVPGYDDPPNCIRVADGTRKLADLLLGREVDAALIGAEMPDDPRVRYLIPEPFDAARRWHARTGIVPINHMFVVDAALSRTRPDVVHEVYRMLAESRAAAPAAAVQDLAPLGLEANRKTLELAIAWSVEQRLIPRALTVDELFDDTTAVLGA